MIQRFVTFVPLSTMLVGCYGWWGAMSGGVLWVVGCYEWWGAMGGGVLWVVGFYVNHVPLSLI